MKKLLIFVFAMVVATSAFAGQSKPKASYDGVIEKYDASAKVLTVQHKDKHGEFVIADTTTVTDGEKKADASALVVGKKVDLDFVMDGSKKVALKVKVGPTATTK